MGLFGLSGRSRIRPSDLIRGALDPDELILGLAVSVDGTELAVTRKRLLVVREGQSALTTPWHRVAKASLRERALTLIGLIEVGELPAGGEVVRDAPSATFELAAPARLTDQVHSRVRRSVVASRHLSWPSGGGWVSMRRVAGQDGLLVQLRLDHGADPDTPGLRDAAERVGAELLGVGEAGSIGEDD